MFGGRRLYVKARECSGGQGRATFMATVRFGAP